MLRYLPLFIAFALIATMTVEIGRRPNAVDAAPFHAAATAVIRAVPQNFGAWEGTDIPVPVSAQALLKPNALLSRVYVDRKSGEHVNFMLVQCRDTRDMAGHYPPICYPGQGWIEDEPRRIVELQVGSRTVNAVRYEFRRHGFDQEKTLVVYNFFAVPGQGLPSDMDAIRRAASDYTARPFGAAQFQIVLDRRRSPDEEKALVQSVLAPLGPAIDLLSDPKWNR